MASSDRNAAVLFLMPPHGVAPDVDNPLILPLTSTPTVSPFQANGFEEIEALTCVDILRRAGFNMDLIGVPDKTIKGAHDVIIQTSTIISDATKKYDVVVLPGGMPGATNLAENKHVIDLLKSQQNEKRWIAAICASPAVVLAQKKLMGRAKGVCYPAMETSMGEHLISTSQECYVDPDHKIITSKGPATAMAFALCIVEQTLGISKAQDLAKAIKMAGLGPRLSDPLFDDWKA